MSTPENSDASEQFWTGTPFEAFAETAADLNVARDDAAAQLSLINRLKTEEVAAVHARYTQPTADALVALTGMESKLSATALAEELGQIDAGDDHRNAFLDISLRNAGLNIPGFAAELSRATTQPHNDHNAARSIINNYRRFDAACKAIETSAPIRVGAFSVSWHENSVYPVGSDYRYTKALTAVVGWAGPSSFVVQSGAEKSPDSLLPVKRPNAVLVQIASASVVSQTIKYWEELDTTVTHHEVKPVALVSTPDATIPQSGTFEGYPINWDRSDTLNFWLSDTNGRLLLPSMRRTILAIGSRVPEALAILSKDTDLDYNARSAISDLADSESTR